MFKAVLLFYDANMRHFFTKIKKKLISGRAPLKLN